MSATEQLLSFGRYYWRVIRQIIADMLALSKAQLFIGVVAGLLIVAIQIASGIVPKNFTRASVLSVVYTYVAIGGLALAFYGIRAPWRLDEQRRKEIEKLTRHNEKHENYESDKARRKWLREQLSERMAEGERISWSIRTQQPDAHNKFDSWLKSVRIFLTSQPEFDRSHLARFDSEMLHALKEFIAKLDE